MSRKLPEIVRRIDAGTSTSEDAAYLLARVQSADYLVERLRRFDKHPEVVTSDDLDDIAAWCDYFQSRRDELEGDEV
jgi:hypothetical protein